MAEQEWSPLVQSLLAALHDGDDIAIASHEYGSHSFNHLALAYMSNAVALCRDGRVGDFRVFMAFYGIRHGLELWLKCTLRNQLIDRGLVCIASGAELEEIAKAAKQDDKRGRYQLKRALCAFRNLFQDHLRAPDIWVKNMDDAWIAKSIECVLDHARKPRARLADLWQLPISGHDLSPLWKEVRFTIDGANARVGSYAKMTAGLVQPAETMTLDATVEMLSELDPSGDAFRYPTSMAGEWFNKLPNVSLKRLGELALLLEETVRAYDAYFEEAYTHSTIRSPWPAEIGY